MNLLGIDTGGTFTDLIYIAATSSGTQIKTHKTLSTPDAPERAILTGITEMGLQGREGLIIIHGSTVATNAALEGKGARTLYIGNRGFKDIPLIARQTRQQLYNLQPSAQHPLPDTLFAEVGGRLTAEGELLTPVTEADLQQLRDIIGKGQPESVAINLLFSFLGNQQEQLIAEALPSGLAVSCSSYILPQQGEYERGIATWLNARLSPLINRYLDNLQQQVAPAPLGIMQSSGGTIDATQAQQRAVNLLLSGPAGGLAAARQIGQLTCHEQLITFDMGGTSTDVSLIQGELKLTSEGRIGPYPIAIPMVDIHTIGAGGGSIAYLDSGGMLQVGPQSAGASPGPACYNNGGRQPTVTDANLILGKLLPDQFLGGRMSLDKQAAEQAIDTLATPLQLSRREAAAGIIKIANEHMARALRQISVEKGYNPSEFTLYCFGGAGGLHLCELAEQLRIERAMVPIHGGIFSALGMITAPRERQLFHTHQALLSALDTNTITTLAELAADGRQQLLDEGVEHSQINHQYFVDLRYQGQSFTLTVPWQGITESSALFHHEHLQRYGHTLDMAVELLNLRCRSFADAAPINLPTLPDKAGAPIGRTELEGQQATIYRRETLGNNQQIIGPAIICEEISTTYLAANWQCTVDRWGNLMMAKTQHKTQSKAQ